MVYFALSYLKVLRITGGASGAKRKKSEIVAYDFKADPRDCDTVKEVLGAAPLVMKTFMTNIDDNMFASHFGYMKEQKNMDRILSRVVQEMPVYAKIGDRVRTNSFTYPPPLFS